MYEFNSFCFKSVGFNNDLHNLSSYYDLESRYNNLVSRYYDLSSRTYDVLCRTYDISSRYTDLVSRTYGLVNNFFNWYNVAMRFHIIKSWLPNLQTQTLYSHIYHITLSSGIYGRCWKLTFIRVQDIFEKLRCRKN